MIADDVMLEAMVKRMSIADGHPYIAIGFLVALVLLIAFAIYRGRSDGTLNFLSGKIVAVKEVDRKKQVYLTISLSSGQKISRTKPFYPDQSKLNTSFSFPLPEKYPVEREALIIELCSAVNEDSLGSGEIALEVLKERSPEAITRDLKVSEQIVTVQAKLVSVHAFFIHIHRFKDALIKNIKLLSFWTRLSALPLAVWIAYDGLTYFRKGGRTNLYLQGLGQSVLGLYLLWLSLPFYLQYVGISILQSFKNESLSFAWGSTVSISGYIAASHNWILNPEEVTAAQKIVHVPLAIVTAGYFLADLRGEPGAGWVRFIGKPVLGSWAYKE